MIELTSTCTILNTEFGFLTYPINQIIKSTMHTGVNKYQKIDISMKYKSVDEFYLVRVIW